MAAEEPRESVGMSARVAKEDPFDRQEPPGYLAYDALTGRLQVDVVDGAGSEVVKQGARDATAQDWSVKDDFRNFEAQHTTLSVSTDVTITFAQSVQLVRILNWDPSNRVLVKNGVISSNTDATATRVGKAPTADVPASRTLPFTTTTIHLRSAGASEVSVEGYFRA